MINRKTVLDIVGGLSMTTKMPCAGYSLSPLHCKMGQIMSKNPNNVCSKCYAKRGHYKYSNVIRAHDKRLQSLKNPLWVDAMVFLINDMKYFRWHDSGDIQDMKHLKMIIEVANRTSNTKHWLPTREFKLLSSYVQNNGKIPKNLIIRLSAIQFESNPPIELAKRLNVLVSGVSKLNYTCPASKQGNECGDCRMCWDKKTFSVTYKRH